MINAYHLFTFTYNVLVILNLELQMDLSQLLQENGVFKFLIL